MSRVPGSADSGAADGHECGSLEGMSLLAGDAESGSSEGRLFSYNWASGYIAPFVPADLDAATSAIEQAAHALHRGHGTGMLHLADLGCGDGRVLLAAAGAHGVSGWGVELDEELVRVARQAARKASADVSIEQGDLLALPAARFAPGTVIFCYLLPAGLAKIAPLLREVLGAVPAALATLRWAVPGLEDLRLDAPDKGFRVYCSQRVRDTVIMST
eukprot:jgi/Tetstr1/439357/TSEL_027792.t1